MAAATRSKRNACSAQPDRQSRTANRRLYEDLEKKIRGRLVAPWCCGLRPPSSVVSTDRAKRSLLGRAPTTTRRRVPRRRHCRSRNPLEPASSGFARQARRSERAGREPAFVLARVCADHVAWLLSGSGSVKARARRRRDCPLFVKGEVCDSPCRADTALEAASESDALPPSGRSGRRSLGDVEAGGSRAPSRPGSRATLAGIHRLAPGDRNTVKIVRHAVPMLVLDAIGQHGRDTADSRAGEPAAGVSIRRNGPR